MRKKNKKPLRCKIVLRLPDLDHAKNSVLNSLSSPNSRRNYRFAMEQFITWYCSEPRLALNRAVVLRFRLHLESLGPAAGTINQRLAAIRRLAYEAADSGLLSPELAAGIRRVKGVKQLGARVGNWLNLEQARLLLDKANRESLRGVRDLAMISILLGCGLRRAELASLRKEDIQVRQGSLGHRRLSREGWSCPYRTYANLGEGTGRQMNACGEGDRRARLQGCQQARNSLGPWNIRKRGLVCCQAVCSAPRSGTPCTP